MIPKAGQLYSGLICTQSGSCDSLVLQGAVTPTAAQGQRVLVFLGRRESASSLLVTARSWSSLLLILLRTLFLTDIVADIEKINEEGCHKFCQACNTSVSSVLRRMT